MPMSIPQGGGYANGVDLHSGCVSVGGAAIAVGNNVVPTRSAILGGDPSRLLGSQDSPMLIVVAIAMSQDMNGEMM